MHHYKILQLTKDNRDLLFCPFVKSRVDINNYEVKYEGDVDYNIESEHDLNVVLERLYSKFNINRPEDFTGHSLSVSDVIELDGVNYYVDSFGFEKF